MGHTTDRLGSTTPRSFSLTQPYTGISLGEKSRVQNEAAWNKFLSPIPLPSRRKLRPQDVCGGGDSRGFLAVGQKSWTPTPSCQSLILPLVAPWPQTAPNRPHPHIPSSWAASRIRAGARLDLKASKLERDSLRPIASCWGFPSPQHPSFSGPETRDGPQ